MGKRHKGLPLGDRTNLVGNKMVVLDCLVQLREDLLAASEDAMKRHNEYRNGLDAMSRSFAEDAAKTLAQCLNRLEMINKAMQELS